MLYSASFFNNFSSFSFISFCNSSFAFLYSSSLFFKSAIIFSFSSFFFFDFAIIFSFSSFRFFKSAIIFSCSSFFFFKFSFNCLFFTSCSCKFSFNLPKISSTDRNKSSFLYFFKNSCSSINILINAFLLTKTCAYSLLRSIQISLMLAFTFVSALVLSI